MSCTKGKCGCTVTILKFDNIEHPVKWRINYCPKHKAVDDLYEALKESRNILVIALDLMNTREGKMAMESMIKQDNEALAKAEGK